MYSSYLIPLAAVLGSLVCAYLSFRYFLAYQGRIFSEAGSQDQNRSRATTALVCLLVSGLVFTGSFYYLFSLSKTWQPPPRATPTPEGGLSQPAPVSATPILGTPTSEGTPTPSPLPSAGFARIGNTNGFGANMRSEPGLKFESLTQLSDGTRIELTGEVQTADGFTWQHVRLEDGRTGWIVDRFLIFE